MLSRRAVSSRCSLTSSVFSFSSSSSSSSAAAAPLFARRFNSDKGNNKSNEDAEELAREQKLREMFQKGGGDSSSQAGGAGAAAGAPAGNGASPMNPFAGVDPKASFMDQMRAVHANAKQFAEQQTQARLGKAPGGAGAGAGGSSSTGGDQSSSGGTQTVQPPAIFLMTQTIWTILLYSTAVYAMVLVWQLSDEQSFVSMTQGVPQWAGNGTDLATFLLFRVIYSYREQNRIRKEYETQIVAGSASSGSNAPVMSFADFLQQRYGPQLNGSLSSFGEAVALVSTAARADFGRYSNMMAQAAKSKSDVRDKVEAVATALKAAGVQPSYAMSAQQQQQQQYYAQQQQLAYQQQLAAYYAQQQQQQYYQQQPPMVSGGGGQQQQQQLQQWPPAEARSAFPNQAQQQTVGDSSDSISSMVSKSVTDTVPSSPAAAAAEAPKSSTA